MYSETDFQTRSVRSLPTSVPTFFTNCTATSSYIVILYPVMDGELNLIRGSMTMPLPRSQFARNHCFFNFGLSAVASVRLRNLARLAVTQNEPLRGNPPFRPGFKPSCPSTRGSNRCFKRDVEKIWARLPSSFRKTSESLAGYNSLATSIAERKRWRSTQAR